MKDGVLMKVQLKVIGGSRAGQLITINVPQFLVGRADDCHLKPRSELISRYHCAILSEDGYVAVRDLGSKNGVYLNGTRISLEEELKNGDILLIGPLEFEVVLSVAVKGEMKPKVTSVADVVERVVTTDQGTETKTAQEPFVGTEPQTDSNTDASDWLMNSDESGNGGETISYNVVENDGDLEAILFGMQKPEDDENGDEKKDENKPEEKKPGLKKDSPSSSDAAANLLKNFFKGNR